MIIENDSNNILAQSNHVHVGWNQALDCVLISMIIENPDEVVTIRVDRKEMERLLPDLAVALFELSSPYVSVDISHAVDCPTPQPADPS